MGNDGMHIYGYFDSEKLIPALLAAAKNNLMISGLKQKLIDGIPMYEVDFMVVKK